MGKGDKKSRKGKIFSGSFGIRRPRKKDVPVGAVSTAPVVEETPKKASTGSAKKKAAKK